MINLAELAICDSNLEAANEYYTEAFSVEPGKAFSKDLTNAFFAAMDTRQYPKAEEYFAKLLSRGLGQTFIKEQILGHYSGKSAAFITSVLQRYRNDTSKTRPLAAQIHRMMKEDQAVRIFFSKQDKGAYMVDSTYEVDYRNAQHLLELFLKNGVPNEHILGHDPWHGFSPRSAPAFYLLILHHNDGLRGGRPAHLLDSLLCEAVFTIDVPPLLFASLVQRSPSSPVFKYKNGRLNLPLIPEGVYFNGKTYPEYYNEVSEQKINGERAKIGLEPLNDFRRKIEALNACLDRKSFLSKYYFPRFMTVADLDSEAALTAWLAKHGKQGTARRSLSAVLPPAMPEPFAIGILGSAYMLGSTRCSERVAYYQRGLKDYYQGTVEYGSRSKNGRPPLPWNYHAELVPPNGDSLEQQALSNKARFIEGYRILIEDSRSFWFGNLRNLELLFGDDTLIHLSALVDTSFYRTITKYIGTPFQIQLTHDTVKLEQTRLTVLSRRRYTWLQGRNQVEILIHESVDSRNRIQVSAEYQMSDVKKYAVYKRLAEKRAAELIKQRRQGSLQ